jgi:hypothetical protein
LKLMGVVLDAALGVPEKVIAKVHRGCCPPGWFPGTCAATFARFP